MSTISNEFNATYQRNMTLAQFLVKYPIATLKRVNYGVEIYNIDPSISDDRGWDICHLSDYSVSSHCSGIYMLRPIWFTRSSIG